MLRLMLHVCALECVLIKSSSSSTDSVNETLEQSESSTIQLVSWRLAYFSSLLTPGQLAGKASEGFLSSLLACANQQLCPNLQCPPAERQILVRQLDLIRSSSVSCAEDLRVSGAECRR